MKSEYEFFEIACNIFNMESVEFFKRSTETKLENISKTRYERFAEYLSSGSILSSDKLKLSRQSVYVRFSTISSNLNMVFSSQDPTVVHREFTDILKTSDSTILRNLRKISKLSKVASSVSVVDTDLVIRAFEGEVDIPYKLVEEEDLYGIKLPINGLMKLAEKIAVYSAKNKCYIGFANPVTTPIKHENKVYLVVIEHPHYDADREPLVFYTDCNTLPPQHVVDKVLAKYKLIGGKV